MAVQGYHSRHDFWNGLEAAMKPWMKIAIGCLAVSILGLFLLVAGLVGFGYWAKNRVEEFTGGGPEVQEARKKANAVPFHRPAGDVIEEPRFVKYIEVRASVYTVYEKYKGELESRMAKIKQGQSLDFGDISTGFTLMGELQRAETLALAKHGMSEDEYAFVNGEVYKSMPRWLSHVGRRPVEATSRWGAVAWPKARLRARPLRSTDRPQRPSSATGSRGSLRPAWAANSS
jgi:hypothetical protein